MDFCFPPPTYVFVGRASWRGAEIRQHWAENCHVNLPLPLSMWETIDKGVKNFVPVYCLFSTIQYYCSDWINSKDFAVKVTTVFFLSIYLSLWLSFFLSFYLWLSKQEANVIGGAKLCTRSLSVFYRLIFLLRLNSFKRSFICRRRLDFLKGSDNDLHFFKLEPRLWSNRASCSNDKPSFLLFQSAIENTFQRLIS